MSTTTGMGSLLRRLAGFLVGLEAAALVAAGVWFGYSSLTRDDAGAMSMGLAILSTLGGLALGWASRALWRGSTWPRGLTLTWQVLQCAVGVTVLEWSTLAGAAAVVVAIAAGALLVVDARRDIAAAGTGSGDAQPGAGPGHSSR
ncbi:hypothetical protein [Demequina sp. SO4-18]|uniref:hypothetical protein n=1 Tax=Demequina sp. SO4-18 TaxID=3401026 RepID=UPI003B5CF9FE